MALAKHLYDRNIPVWIRYVLIPGITDSEDDLEALGEFVSNLSNIEKVEVLPYHILGMHKWECMGFEYPLKGVPEATKEDIEQANKILSKYKIKIKSRAS